MNIVNKPHPWQQSAARGIAMAVIAIVSCLILLELGIRCYFSFRIGDPSVLLYPLSLNKRNLAINSMFPTRRQNGYLNYRPGPLATYVGISSGRNLEFSTYESKINSLGFRGEEIAPRSRPDELRIACLGESSTFGYLLSDEDTYPAKLQQFLRKALKRPVSVFNLGISESTTDWQLHVLREYLDKVDPDIVTFYGIHNDIRDLIFPQKSGFNRVNRFFMLQLLFQARELAGSRNLGGRDALDAGKIGHIRQNLASMASLLKSRNIAFYFVRQRIVDINAAENESYADYYKFLVEGRKKGNIRWNVEHRVAYWHYPLIRSFDQAASPGMRIVDPTEILKKSDFFTPVHPNKSGAVKLADAIGAAILKSLNEHE